MDDEPSAASRLAELEQRRDAAQERVHDTERQQRAAGQAREQARRELVEGERDGVTPARRSKLEKALSDAEGKLAQPWEQRFQGARQAVTQAQRAVSEFTREHLDELVEDLVAEGEAAAEAMNAAAEAFVQAYHRRAQIDAAIARTVQSAGFRVQPGDVSRSRAEAAVNEVRRLLGQGGELPPRLIRDPRPAQSNETAESAAA